MYSHIVQIPQPSQYGYAKLQYRFAVTSGSLSSKVTRTRFTGWTEISLISFIMQIFPRRNISSHAYDLFFCYLKLANPSPPAAARLLKSAHPPPPPCSCDAWGRIFLCPIKHKKTPTQKNLLEKNTPEKNPPQSVFLSGFYLFPGSNLQDMFSYVCAVFATLLDQNYYFSL